MGEIYRAQALNVRSLEKSLKQIAKTINFYLRKNDKASYEVFARVYTQVYCAWAEASFSKIIHTPFGFSMDEIEQIKTLKSVEEKWIKALELAMRKISSQKSGDIENKKKRFQHHVAKIIIEPSLLRNKIAHGQWRVALNRENTAINEDLTSKINSIDFVKIRIWFICHKNLNLIFEDMIKSPNKAHHRDYWIYLTKIEKHLTLSESWNLKSHIEKLMEKQFKDQQQ